MFHRRRGREFVSMCASSGQMLKTGNVACDVVFSAFVCSWPNGQFKYVNVEELSEWQKVVEHNISLNLLRKSVIESLYIIVKLVDVS